MIKRIEIENAFGIKSFSVDFTLKNVQNECELESQLLCENKEKIAAMPTFLAKNAAGKTSFIKAINFALRFATYESFIRELVFYKTNEMLMRFKSLNLNTGEFKVFQSISATLFKEISFAGSNETKITLHLTKNRYFSLELTNTDFIVKINDQIINVRDVYEQLNINNPDSYSRNEMSKYLRNCLEKIISESTFLQNVNQSVLFRDTTPMNQINEIMIKNVTNLHIKILMETFGFETTKFLLLKLDSNINKIDYDAETEDFNIYLKSVDLGFPISSKSLSFGTQKVLEILSKSVPLFKDGGIMMIDEIENGLHLSMIKLIVSIFSNPEINLSNAQLLMTTHNPLLAEREIIQPYNLFMVEESNFVNVKSLVSKNRSEDIYACIKSKNYYNDLYWINKNSEVKSTLSKLAINQIIHSMAESDKWHQK